MKTKELIMQKMLGLMLRKGYASVSVSDLQETTGMARGLLYHYFSNQDELRVNVIKIFVNDYTLSAKFDIKKACITDFITELVSYYQKIGEYLQTSFENDVNIIDLKLLLNDAARHNTELFNIILDGRNRRNAMWKTAVLNSFGRGELRRGLNLESLARHFAYLEEGFFFTVEKRGLLNEIIYNFEKRMREFYEVIERN